MAGPERNLDLNAVLERLRHEPIPSRDGHRQETVLHRDALRLVLFAFDAGGRLESHRAPGVVTIHMLRGRMRVATATSTYELEPFQMVVLDPDVLHEVEALMESDMLLGITLEKNPGPSPLE
jgi:quercetin dioxygenase-like cupin family protein